jgi:heme-degrading monooxygenase HmoA
MFVILWRYEVAPQDEAAFRAAYGSTGDWAQLFGQAPGFLGTSLYRDDAAPGVFVTLDTWIDEAAFSAFQAAHGATYSALDAKHAGLSKQTRIGAVTT